jgi:hypothetical protein
MPHPAAAGITTLSPNDIHAATTYDAPLLAYLFKKNIGKPVWYKTTPRQAVAALANALKFQGIQS